MSDWSWDPTRPTTTTPTTKSAKTTPTHPVAKQLSVGSLKLKAMRQVLRSTPTAARGAIALDLILLLKELPAGVMTRFSALATTFSFSSGTETPPPIIPPSSPVGGGRGSRINRQQSKGDAATPSSNPSPPPSNEDKDTSLKSSSPQGVKIPLGSPLKRGMIPTSGEGSTSSSVLKNMIEINSQNNRVIESRMLSELTREQLLSSSQEESTSHTPIEEGAASTSTPPPSPPPKRRPFSSPPPGHQGTQFLESNYAWQNIEARTKHLVAMVAKSAAAGNGNSKHNLITHLDELYSHLYQHHDTRFTALAGGGVKILVKVLKLHEGDLYILHKAREILALLGNNPPTKGQGIKILAIDGGGVRGLVALEVLRAIERITGKRVYELFDYICGVSTGSILAFLLGAHKKTLEEAELLYKDLSREIFSQNSFLGSAALLWSHSYYHTPTFEKILKKHCGELPLITLARDPELPRVSAISTVVNQERVCPYVFRTYALPPTVRAKYLGGCRYHMWEAVRASAAAPTYFEEIKLGNYLHQDGGVLCNNPTSVAISEAKTIWQDQPLQCVVSLGTGLTLSNRSDKNLNDLIEHGKEGLSYLSWKGKFLKVLDSATDTESVHNTLNELLPHSIYFRLNPYLTDVVRLDEGDPAKLERVQQETRAYLERNVEKVQFACKTLLREKGMGKKVADWWYHP